MENIHAELDPESLRRLILMAREAPTVLKTSVYAGLRASAEPAAEAARQAVLSAPSEGSRHTGLRQNIAAGVKIGLSASARSAGIKITSSNSALPANQYRMNRTFDKETFYHPVFGHKPMVAQRGKEWFYGPIRESRPLFHEGVQKAMDETAERLAHL